MTPAPAGLRDPRAASGRGHASAMSDPNHTPGHWAALAAAFQVMDCRLNAESYLQAIEPLAASILAGARLLPVPS
jgi:hypothetical protein